MQAASRRAYDWTDIWERHLDRYLAAEPRAGVVMRQMLRDGFTSVLEIACGSARDSLFLQSAGKEVVATDNNPAVIAALQRRFTALPGISFRVEDAARLRFPSRRFDLSFHSGFYVYFDDDEIIKAMLREQCRVTRRHVLFFVHNAHNPGLRAGFRSSAPRDGVYDIRFFERDELAALVRSSGIAYRDMRIGKFGSRLDALLSPKLKGLSNPFCRVARDHLALMHRLTPLHLTERLVCHITL